ncbi:MAG: aspartyl protease family protein [Bacteroidota bacterium]
MITTIPFEIMEIDGEGFHLLLKMHINDMLADVIIDTGASKTVFDTQRIIRYVKHNNFGKHEKLTTGLGTNSMKSHVTNLEKIRIGELEISNYKTVLLDLSHVNESYRQVGFSPVEGVLGSDILTQYKAVIDYEKKTLNLKFKKSSPKKPLKDARTGIKVLDPMQKPDT